MSKKVVTLPIEEFEELVNKLKECMAANDRLNKQIEEYNEKFANKDNNDARYE